MNMEEFPPRVHSLSNEENSKRGAMRCENCRFYECELIDGFKVFKKNNPDKSSYSLKPRKVEVVSDKQGTRRVEKPDPRPLSYNPKENKNVCHMHHDLNQIYHSSPSIKVADAIGDSFKIDLICDRYDLSYKVDESYAPHRPRFISAQTGRGKNYFIEDVLLPYVRTLNLEKDTRAKVLILSNRRALKLQIEDRLKRGISAPDFEEHLELPMDGYADVMSYQGFWKNVKNIEKAQEGKRPRYIYVVCDEAHFFTSDAMFNPDTDKILSSIVKIFSDVIRIYMTATPYECLDEIIKLEEYYVYFYHFKRDYSYLDIKYFSNHNELKEIIAGSGSEKWLIFIDNKRKCQKYQGELEQESTLKGKVYAVDSRSKHEEKYQKMVLNEQLDKETKILIATSVIDNGVNFRDIQNVVISDISMVKCLQMVGRARVNLDKGERITLYIKRFTVNEVKSRITQLQRQQDAYHDYVTSNEGKDCRFIEKYFHTDNFEDWEGGKHWFGLNRERGLVTRGNVLTEAPTYVFNKIASSLADTYVQTYEAILREMEGDKTSKLPGQKYLEYQLSWFGQKYSLENDITLKDKDEGRKALVEFLEVYVSNGDHMLKDEQDKFSQKFTELHDKAFVRIEKNKERDYGIVKINGILDEHNFGYKVVTGRGSTGDRKTYWKVVRA